MLRGDKSCISRSFLGSHCRQDISSIKEIDLTEEHFLFINLFECCIVLQYGNRNTKYNFIIEFAAWYTINNKKLSGAQFVRVRVSTVQIVRVS